MTIPTDLTAGAYYYFVKIKVDGFNEVASDIATVTINAAQGG